MTSENFFETMQADFPLFDTRQEFLHFMKIIFVFWKYTQKSRINLLPNTWVNFPINMAYHLKSVLS